MGNVKPAPAASGKKEKIFHPQSRKAAQITRTQLRKNKLVEASNKRSRKYHAETDFYGFWYHAMPPVGETLTLQTIHTLIADVWLVRHDAELDSERAARRKGRPKSTREQQLEDIKLREAEEYRTGMEIPDLTHKTNVGLFRRWDQKEIAFTQLLRHIRVSSTKPDVASVSRPGKHPSLIEENQPGADQPMDVATEDLILTEPPTRFASTMMTMDEPM
ncbi:hypothetical protein GLOTRDRAFT_59779 [Gloeophyllum trabeum ATCC 11539]|uniref:Translation machinery-associated protein 16 n=1 Tax=Gloeophyllum trabeum (strain ATCC 11539 / FP-39264 / Madison 617) TaxID=670483 RepID=S7RTN9_GLOTA|nr:uncharacterized protein GLOTRDRAFT_59779 [Gloeophyllum trabeum ATCC 11539]EPQ56489.1 hypothetical protein GLOTRDRAFT_59779 [Gloeophyllum trabeum ATCC 11539]